MFLSTQNSQGMSESTTDIVCVKSVAYEAVSTKPPVYDYVIVKGIHPKSSSGDSNYMELGSHPLDAAAVLPELGQKKVLYSNAWKQAVSCSL